jgi:hypothetical protein
MFVEDTLGSASDLAFLNTPVESIVLVSVRVRNWTVTRRHIRHAQIGAKYFNNRLALAFIALAKAF